jgi:transcriptional regulator with XRE-family HTH domain
MFLPSSAEQALKDLGNEVRLARKRRQWTISDLASKMGVSAPTVIAIEQGQPTVGMGILFSALWILGLEKELSMLSYPDDRVGLELANRRLPKKVRHAVRKVDNDF